ncbi:hypothetical protein [Candidatus Borreliella tachyglossi]|uniref:hypothetical protein n=1 Tax=Candidatus Borreliella tachyglossi TaxID=1964448 RepID=UPI004041CF0E
MNKKLTYISLLILFISCFNKSNKYGIVLDSNNIEKLPNGSLVKIKNTNLNQSKQTITIDYNGTKFIVHQFTIEEFQEEAEAEKFRLNIKPYINKYAINKKDILPLRASPDNYKDNIIYRIPKDAILKIISIGEKTEAGSLQGRWVYTLTKDGYKGYVFDYALEIFDNIAGTLLTVQLNQDSQNEVISIFQNIKHLRPLYYAKMLSNRTYNSNLLREDYGLFFTINNEIKINMSGLNLDFKFDVVDGIKPSGFLFRSRNSEEDFICLEKDTQNHYNVLVKVREHNFEVSFVIIEQSIEKIILEAEKQNKKLIDRLISYKALINEQYGDIEFKKDKTFIWKTNEQFNNFPSSGNFEVIGLSPSLQISYKNAIKLITKEGKKYFCLLDYTNSALQLVFIDPRHVEDDLIITEDKNKIIVILFKDPSSQNIFVKKY